MQHKNQPLNNKAHVGGQPRRERGGGGLTTMRRAGADQR